MTKCTIQDVLLKRTGLSSSEKYLKRIPELSGS